MEKEIKSLSDKIEKGKYAYGNFIPENWVKEFINLRNELDLVRSELGEDEYIKQRDKLAGPELT